jgi:tetratricopeptide (TPR) repeat protein
MKRKTKAGLILLDGIEKEVEELKLDVQQLFHTFRGYGYMIKRKFEAAYEAYTKVKSTDNSSIFNKHICSGIIKLKEKKYSEALKFFSEAMKVYPDKKIILVYQFVTYISAYIISR